MANKKYSLKHKKELNYILFIVVVGGILLLGFFGPDGYLKLKKERLEVQKIEARVDELDRSNSERWETIESYRSDPEAIEQLARERGYGRENEIVQHLPENPEDPENPGDAGEEP